MGYTHYFGQTKDFTVSEWSRIVDATKHVIDHAGVKLAYEYNEPEEAALVDKDTIRFNGVGENGHETFIITRKKDPEAWGFCKTARKPYDDVVVAVLVIAATVAPKTFSWSSDGKGEEHARGKELAENALAITAE